MEEIIAIGLPLLKNTISALGSNPIASGTIANVLATIALRYIGKIKRDEENSRPVSININNVLIENNFVSSTEVLNKRTSNNINEMEIQKLSSDLSLILNRKDNSISESIGLILTYLSNLSDGLQESINLDDYTQKGFIELKLGNIFFDLNLYEESIKLFEKSEDTFSIVTNELGQAKALYNLATAYARNEQYEKAISKYNEALVIFDSLNDYTSKIETLIKLGNSYNQQNFNDKAIEKYKEAINLDNTNLYTARIWISIANCQFEKGYIDEALEIYKKYFSLLDNVGNKENIDLISNLGVINFKKGNWNEAIKLFEEYLGMNEKNSYRKGQILLFLGNAHVNLNNLNKALYYYGESRKMFELLKLDELQGKLLKNEALIYYELGDRATSLSLLEKSLKMFKDGSDDANQAWELLDFINKK